MKDKEAVRRTLVSKRDELQDRRERLAAHGRDGVPADFEEQAVARENDEVVARLREQVETELREIGAALERLDDGEFGRCGRCGAHIEAARLEVLPQTMFCSRCARL